ncbi:NAD-dependent epimerase/dehydratase family protein [Enterococcus sp. DIV0187]|uniref:NAD-dependent epimerase/dehydratase family protein n=1 Tax=Enterococcus sp. DIV0187 TaxID=2774644 RepID=UPI003F263953
MKKYLITGGAGFIGSTLANHLSKNNKVFIIDDLSMGKKSNVKENDNIKFILGSVTDENLMKQVLSQNNFDYIFHLAAVASVADSVERPIETHTINFDSVLLLLELVRKYQTTLSRFIFSSSAAVYGDEQTLPKKEESIIRPLTPYAIDKFSAEQYVLAYNHLYGVPTSAVRFFNVYGPNQNPNSPYSGVISILMKQYKNMLTGKRAKFTVFGDGEQSRDFVYIDDVIQALLLVSKAEESLGKQFNVGTGTAISLNELISVLNQQLGVELPVEFISSRSGDIPASLSSIERLKKLGFINRFSIEQGLRNYLKFETMI